MSERDESTQPAGQPRREFLKLVGGSVVLVPLSGLVGCGGGDEPAGTPAAAGDGAAAPKETGTEAAASGEPAGEGSDAAGQGGAGGDASGMPKLAENDPQAQSLGYVHDASTVDKAKYSRYQAGQRCDNCALYQAGKGGADWGGCSIFPGKLVNAAGWCNVYTPMPG